MKKLFYILFLFPIFFGCESKEDVLSDIEALQQKRSSMQTEIASLGGNISNLRSQIGELNEKLKEAKIIDSGKTPQYVLKLNLSQSHTVFDLDKMIKDGMNDVDFEMPVSKEFYEKVKSGDRLVDDFRVGSFIMEGSFGSWDLKVTGKEIR